MIKLNIVSLNYTYENKKQDRKNQITSAVHSSIATITDYRVINKIAQVIEETTEAINTVLAKHDIKIDNFEDEEDEEDEELELSDEQLERNDDIDNAVFDCIRVLAEDDDMEWNMQVIGESTDAIKSVLSDHNIKVRHPHIAGHADGSQTIEEYDEELG